MKVGRMVVLVICIFLHCWAVDERESLNEFMMCEVIASLLIITIGNAIQKKISVLGLDWEMSSMCAKHD